jgi:hypothetical protein
MTINVSQSTSSYSVKLKATPKFKVSVSAEASSVAGNLSDLDDFNATGVQNGYVVMYDAATQKYITVDPDTVLSNAVTGGLPSNFVDKLDVDLDDKIDLDAGGF